MPKEFITSHQELHVYQMAFESAMEIFAQAQSFPHEERTLLTEQIVRSSRWVCAHLAHAWQQRRSPEAFIVSLSAVAAAAAETQTWIEFAIMCSYLDAEPGQELFGRYGEILAGTARLIDRADTWGIS